MNPRPHLLHQPAGNRPRKPRVVAKKVTKADLDRVAEFLRSMGARPAAVDITPDRVRITTTEGGNLTLTGEEEELDRELQRHLAKYDGHGQT